jgi:hypothetical protein
MNLPLEELRSLVDFDAGVVAVGFSVVDEEELQRTRERADDAEGVHQRLVESMSRGASPSRRLENLIPTELRKAAVSEYLSTLRYEHSEVALFLNAAGARQLGSEKMLAIGCDVENGVYVKERAYHPGYSWVYVRCDAAGTLAILQFAVQQRSKPFASGAMARIATNPGRDDRRSYYCSKLTLACLEHLPLPDFHLNPTNKLNNDDIYAIVVRNTNSTTEPQRMVPAQLRQVFPNMPEESAQKVVNRRI